MSKQKQNQTAFTQDNNHVAEGKLIAVQPTRNVTEKFSTRQFVIDMSYDFRGDHYKNYGVFQLTNHKCDLIDFHKIGDEVRVHFTIGSPAKQDSSGNPVVYTNLNAYRIEKVKEEPIDVPGNLHNWQQQNMASHQSEADWAHGSGNAGVNNSQPIDDLPF